MILHCLSFQIESFVEPQFDPSFDPLLVDLNSWAAVGKLGHCGRILEAMLAGQSQQRRIHFERMKTDIAKDCHGKIQNQRTADLIASERIEEELNKCPQ